jgi:hypothetical protein
MKNIKVTLYEWKYKNTIKNSVPEDFFDIDWPKVQKEIGEDHIKWIWEQPKEDCQLMLELGNQGNRKLIVEFYNNKTAQTYGLMWAR